MKAAAVTRHDVRGLLESIVDNGAPYQANAVLAATRKIFNWGIENDIIATNPCHLIKQPQKLQRRDRVLTESEIRTFWGKLDTAAMSDGTKLALRLQLVTAQRPGEVLGACWEEFDLETSWWTVPAEHAKNKLSHRVPLSDLASDLLSQVREQSRKSEFLFPYSKRGTKKPAPIAVESLSHALRRNTDHFALKHFTPHDLQRTAASQMTSAGVPRLVVSKLLNHVEPGVTAIYDRHSYDKEKRQALDAWARKLTAIISGKKDNNVVGLARP